MAEGRPANIRCPACDNSDIRVVHRFPGNDALRCRVCRLDFVPESVAPQRGSLVEDEGIKQLRLRMNPGPFNVQTVYGPRRSSADCRSIAGHAL